LQAQLVAVSIIMPNRLARAILTVVPNDRKTVLHVGCGPADPLRLHCSFREADWRVLRLDTNPAVAPDIVASATEMPMVADGSVDAVWSQRALDNLAPREMPRALAEFRRVLDKDGFALLALAEPHIAAATLRTALIEAGFAHVEIWETASELWAKAHKGVPAADIGA
jgi:ubiquinone/menaquinone biosynthesis C-methylase UbiE